MPKSTAIFKRIDLSEQRKLDVYHSISRASDPNGSFFLLVALSTLIAAFGLVMNSTAVVIGAMLVAPLMTPILGMALALVRGDGHLFRIALRSEMAGVLVAIVASACLGILVPSFEPTSEMLSRTEPNLFDLLVAVFAGLAGAYALVDERLSPVLPGVAISTAIVPPLANVGLSLSLGAYQGAAGSFLLFCSNFLSILLVSSAIFFIAGMAGDIRAGGVVLVRRFGMAVAGFVVMAILLSGNLLNMVNERRLSAQIHQVLQQELDTFALSDLKRVLHTEDNGRILVFAEVEGPKEPSPRQVTQVQDRLADNVNQPVELYLRTTITHDVSASGAIAQGVIESMDGFFSPTVTVPEVVALQKAEQVVREYLDSVLGVHLTGIDSLPANQYTVFIATLRGIRNLYAAEIAEIESRLRRELGNERLWFLANQAQTVLSDSMGAVRAEWLGLDYVSDERLAFERKVWKASLQWLAERFFWVENWSLSMLDGHNVALFEVKGPQVFTEADLEAFSVALSAAIGLPLKVYVRARVEHVLGSEEPLSYEAIRQKLLRQSTEKHPDQFRRVLEGVR